MKPIITETDIIQQELNKKQKYRCNISYMFVGGIFNFTDRGILLL
jgi:hypothetical protein